MMGSQMLDILRQGVWASLSGGWYYDPHHRLFTNTFHLYTWLFLFTLPLSLHLYFPTSAWYVWLVYAGIIGVTFTIIKVVNGSLHHLFDTGEVVEESEGGGEEGEQLGMREMGPSGTSTPPTPPTPRHGRPRRPQGEVEEPPSVPFPLRVDVHSGTVSTEPDVRQRLPVPEEVIAVGQERGEGDVVILVDESPGGEARRPVVTAEEVVAAANSTNVSFSSMTASSQPTVSTTTTVASQGMDTARRFSNLSNLARSLPSGSSPTLETATGSLDLAAILEPGYMDLVRRRQGARTAQVRRTKSALETGLVLAIPPTPSLPAEEQVQGEVQVMVEEAEHLGRGSDTDLAAYQEQLEEATAALLRAGQYLEAETGGRYTAREERATGAQEEERRGSGVYVPMVGSTSTDREEEGEEKNEREEREVAEVLERELVDEMRESSLLSTVGLDWLFSDSEPDQPPGSPKPVEKSELRSRSESPRGVEGEGRWRSESPRGEEGEVEGSREPRDSSHGSSGTDTETR